MQDEMAAPFQEVLFWFRTQAGLTQEELAGSATLTAQAISKLERGTTRRPHAETIALLATALDLSAEERSLLQRAGRGRLTSGVWHAYQMARKTPTSAEPLPGAVVADQGEAARLGLSRKREDRHSPRSSTNTDWLALEEYRAAARGVSEGLSNPHLYAYLSWKYGRADDEILVRCGEVYPLAVYRAPKSQINSVESVLLSLDQQAIPDDSLGPKSARPRELLMRAGLPVFNRRTYISKRLHVNGDIGIECQMGWYFQMLDTCHALEWEILSAASSLKTSSPAAFEEFEHRLPLRSALHSRVDNPILEGSGRSPAIGISTLIAFNDGGNYYLLLRKRSSRGVAVHSGLIHAIPSFMFQPATIDLEPEFSVIHNIYREYLEELFDRDEPEQRAGDWRYFYGDHRLKFLQSLLARRDAELMLSGLAVNLFAMRPEICTVLLIRSPRWALRHNQDPSDENRFHYNVEWADVWADIFDATEGNDDGDTLLAKVPFFTAMTDEELARAAHAHPRTMVPAGAAAFWLGVDLLRDIL